MKELKEIADTIAIYARRVIQNKKKNKINSWLIRIDWHKYLKELN